MRRVRHPAKQDFKEEAKRVVTSFRVSIGQKQLRKLERSETNSRNAARDYLANNGDSKCTPT